MTPVEIILLILLTLLTIVILVVSWQVFFFFKELRQTRQQVENLIGKLDLASQRLLLPIADLSLAWRFLTHSGRLFKIIDKLLDKPKHGQKQR
ncbi:MAG: hypothetical protein GXP43_00835 [bacterium]|nr:hypothetical protein [bacterium]